MVEWSGVVSGPAPIGFPVEPHHVDLDIYRLICVFAGSSQLADLESEDAVPFQWVRRNFEVSEASRLLLSIAVTARNNWDVQPQYASHSVPPHAIVGSLIGDLDQPDVEGDLHFREACNKIIHAARIRFDLPSQPAENGVPSLNPVVHLYGTHGKKNWRATVKIYRFARWAFAAS